MHLLVDGSVRDRASQYNRDVVGRSLSSGRKNRKDGGGSAKLTKTAAIGGNMLAVEGTNTEKVAKGSVQKLGGSGRLCQLWAWAGDRLKELAEPRTEHAVVDRTANLEQKIGASSRPSHLLRFVHSAIDKEVRSPFGHRSSDTQAGAISLGVIHEPVALAVEIAVDFVQRRPQLA